MKKTSAIIITCLFVFCASNIISASSKGLSKKCSLSAQAAILVDITANKILFSRRRHKQYSPASTVKLLTAYIALKKLGYNSKVKISKKASQAEPTKVWLPPGATFSSGELIRAVLISSANDASVALAEAVSGSEQKFSQLMNKTARSFGAKNSNFTNASGLPAKYQYSTAYDLYRIAKAVLKNRDIYNIMREKKQKIKGCTDKEILLVNHNKLLFRKSYPLVLVKTGYTKSAKHCYAGKIFLRRREYIFAFLKSKKPWDDIDYFINLINRQKN